MEEPKKRRLKLSPGLAIIGTVAIYLSAQIIGSLIVSFYPVFKRWSPGQTTIWFNNSTWAQFWLIGTIEVITIVLLKYLLNYIKVSFKTLGLKMPTKKDLLYSLTGFLAYFASYIIIFTLLGIIFPSINIDQKQDIGFTGAKGISLALVFLSLVVLPAIVEEIVVRGFLYSGLKTKFRIWQAAIVTSLLFSVAHLQLGNSKPLVWSAALDTFVLSLVLIYLREKTGGLAAPIGLHLIKNTLAFITLFIIAAP